MMGLLACQVAGVQRRRRMAIKIMHCCKRCGQRPLFLVQICKLAGVDFLVLRVCVMLKVFQTDILEMANVLLSGVAIGVEG